MVVFSLTEQRNPSLARCSEFLAKPVSGILRNLLLSHSSVLLTVLLLLLLLVRAFLFVSDFLRETTKREELLAKRTR